MLSKYLLENGWYFDIDEAVFFDNFVGLVVRSCHLNFWNSFQKVQNDLKFRAEDFLHELVIKNGFL